MPGKATWENGGSAGIYIGLRNSKISKNRFRMNMPNHMKMVIGGIIYQDHQL